MITIAELRCAYDGKTVLDVPLHELPPGVHGIVGLNGAGKTTLLNALCGFGRNAEARVLFAGESLSHRNTAFQEAENYFHPGITGREYLELFAGGTGSDTASGLNDLLEVPLDTLITSYSTGMRRKLALLGALYLNRPVVMLDEPMNGLDLTSVRVLEAIVKRLGEQGRTVLITSHVLGPLIAVCDRIHLLAQGRFTRAFERGQTEGLEQDLFADLDQRTNAVLSNWRSS